MSSVRPATVRAVGVALQLAIQAFEAGEVEGACRYLLELHALSAGTADSWNLLGIIHSRLESYENAVIAFERAHQLSPQHPDVASNLGVALCRIKQPRGLTLVARERDRNPQSTQLVLKHMECLELLERLPDAVTLAMEASRHMEHWEPIARRALPVAVHARLVEEELYLLQRLVVHQGDDHALCDSYLQKLVHANRLDEGLKFARLQVERAQHEPYWRFRLGNILLQICRQGPSRWFTPTQVIDMENEAVTQLEAVVQEKANAETTRALALAYAWTNQLDKAEATFQQSLQLSPKHPLTCDEFGNFLMEVGRVDAAIGYLETAVREQPKLGRSQYRLTIARKSSDPQRDIDLLNTLLADSTLPNPQKIFLKFAQAKVLEDDGRFDEAFEAYRQGNALKPRPDDSFREDHASRLKLAKDVFTSFDWQQHARHAHSSTHPVFIVGMPRSGTTLTEQILSSHPDVYGAGELKWISYLAHHPTGMRRKSPLVVPKSADEWDCLQKFAAEFADHLHTLEPKATYVIDKMPTNFLHLGLIALMFPQARIIHTQRDPLDICLSCFKKNLDWPFCDLEAIAVYYQQYLDWMALWQELLPIRRLDIVYEELVQDPESQSRRLVDFLDLPWNDACLDFIHNDRAVRTPSKWQVRQPIYTSSIGGWQRYAQQLQPLRLSLKHNEY